MRGIYLIPLILFLFFFQSCADDKPDMNTVHNEVLAVLENYETAHENRDLDLLRNCFSAKPDIIILGTDEKELWVDRESLLAEQEKFYNAAEEVRLSVRDRVIKICDTGVSAWFYMKVNWNVKTTDGESSLENIRSTGVMNKENGTWGIVMMHTSMPYKGQVIKY